MKSFFVKCSAAKGKDLLQLLANESEKIDGIVYSRDPKDVREVFGNPSNSLASPVRFAKVRCTRENFTALLQIFVSKGFAVHHETEEGEKQINEQEQVAEVQVPDEDNDFEEPVNEGTEPSSQPGAMGSGNAGGGENCF